MRIAWLTPWAAESAIAQFSVNVVTELRATEGVVVDVFYPAGAGGRTAPDAGQVIGPETLDLLRDYDTVIYNMGNHLAFHGAIHELSLELPGTVILHDIVLTHVFLTGLLRLREELMAEVLESWYGPAGRREVAALRRDPAGWLWTPGKVEQFPMLRPALEGANQVITHSRYAAGIVRDDFIGNVHHLGLPWLDRPRHVDQPQTIDWLDERPVVLQAGAVNANKRVDMIVDAFAEYDLARHFQLVIAGHVQPKDKADLERRVARAGLTESVFVLGSVDDRVMSELRQRAAIATVLRSPVTESASAVLVDSMAYGLATVALETGHYKEHPADVVQFLTAPTTKALGELLTSWAQDMSIPARRGRVAAAYAEERHSAASYARDLLQVLPFGGALRRRRDLASAMADLVERNGFSADSHLGRHVAAEAAALFGHTPRRGRH
jgi:glycosyltransferase involved in cell wall biosynthesis